MTGLETGLLISAIGSGLFGNLFGSSSQNRRQKQEIAASKDIAQIRDKTDRDLALQDLAAKESMLNPFRSILSQIGALKDLDFTERASYTPVKVNAAGPYAQYVPQRSGGFSYDRDPTVRRSAGVAKQAVLAGKGVPTMTNPANYGMSGALDLLGLIGGTVRPWQDESYARTYPTTSSPAARGTLAVPLRSPRRVRDASR